MLRCGTHMKFTGRFQIGNIIMTVAGDLVDQVGVAKFNGASDTVVCQ